MHGMDLHEGVRETTAHAQESIERECCIVTRILW